VQARQAQHLCQIFRKWLPIVFVPPVKETLRIAIGETFVVKNEFRCGAAVRELELHNRVDARIPVGWTSGLDNSRVGNQLDLPPNDNPAKRREGAAHFRD
jgi:hypothetical protein